jgi:DNA invertase Pin-like site-specific DNA recombinase
MTNSAGYEDTYTGMTPMPGEFDREKFGIYPRVSTKAQAKDNKSSQDAQIEACQEYGEALGMELDRECVRKEAHTSTGGERPQLNALLQDMKARGVKHLVIDRVDRMTRADPFSAYNLLQRIMREHNIWLHIVTAGIVIRDEDGIDRFLDMAKAARAANKARVGAKMRTVKYNAKHKNQYVKGNRPAYGYEYNADRKLVADRREKNGGCPWEVRRQICLDYLGGMSMWAIAEKLSLAHIPTSDQLAGWENANPNWNASTIHYILSSPLNYGGDITTLRTKLSDAPRDKRHTEVWKKQWHMPPEKQLPITDLVLEPVITKEQHEAIQDRLRKARGQSHRNSGLADYALLRGGMAKCGLARPDDPTRECGASLRVKWTTGTRTGPLATMRYICTAHEKQPHTCAGMVLQRSYLDLAVWLQVYTDIVQPGRLEELARQQAALDTANDPASHLAGLKRDRENLERKRANMLDTISEIDERWKRAPYQAKLEELEEMLHAAEENIVAYEALAADQARQQAILSNVAWQVDRYLRKAGALSLDVIRTIFDNVDLDTIRFMHAVCESLGVKVTVLDADVPIKLQVEYNLGAAAKQPWFPAPTLNTVPASVIGSS